MTTNTSRRLVAVLIAAAACLAGARGRADWHLQTTVGYVTWPTVTTSGSGTRAGGGLCWAASDNVFMGGDSAFAYAFGPDAQTAQVQLGYQAAVGFTWRTDYPGEVPTYCTLQYVWACVTGSTAQATSTSTARGRVYNMPFSSPFDTVDAAVPNDGQSHAWGSGTVGAWSGLYPGSWSNQFMAGGIRGSYRASTIAEDGSAAGGFSRTTCSQQYTQALVAMAKGTLWALRSPYGIGGLPFYATGPGGGDVGDRLRGSPVTVRAEGTGPQFQAASASYCSGALVSR